MLKAEFFVSDSGAIKGFDISGHSGYEQSGKDIVCAAVSSAAYMVVNTVADVIRAEVDAKVDEAVGHMNFLVHDKYLSDCSYILQGFKNHLLFLEEMYPENIEVFYKEV